MTDKEKIEKLIELALTLEEDAQMALDGTWDKSDDGFEDQVVLINQTLMEINK